MLVGADYSAFNADGELDLYDEATGHGTFTAEYLADRPELLAAMVQTNLADIAPDASGTTIVPGLSTTFVDRRRGPSADRRDRPQLVWSCSTETGWHDHRDGR